MRLICKLFSAVVVVPGLLCISTAYTAVKAQAQVSPGDIIVTSPAEGVVPSEFNYDLRKLPYYALPSSANRPKPYLPLRRPPFVPKKSTGPGALAPYLPSLPSAYLPLAPVPAPAPVVNVPGVGFEDTCTFGVISNQCGGGIPPDPNGDIGPNHFIQAINTAYGIYDKTGALLVSFTEDYLWSTSGSNPCNGNSSGDTIVVYDRLGDRWILTNFAFVTSSGNPVPPFYECIAVSKTNDPVTGGWWLYPVRVDTGAAGQPPVGTLNDYPKFGVWPDCLYMSANGFGGVNAATFNGVLFAAFSRRDLEAGNTLSWTLGFVPTSANPPNDIFTMIPSTILNASPSSLPPPGTPNYYVSESQNSFAFEVRTFATSNNCSTGTFNTTPVSVSQTTYDTTFLSLSNGIVVPQPNTFGLLDTVGDRLLQKVPYRKIGSAESLWVVHSVTELSTSTVQPQWAQIDVTGGTVATTPPQQQIVTDDGLYRWMGSLSVDKDGSMALGYSTSNHTAPNFPSIAYSGRLAGDPPGTLPQTETQLFAGNGSQTVSCGSATPCDRWGDYSGMSVDPSDDCTFWYTNEYYANATDGSNGFWKTRIGAFRFTTCDPTALVRQEGPPNSTFSGIGAAYIALTGADSLDIQSITFYESVDLNGGFDVILKGGFDSSFLSNTGFSALHGTLTVTTGIATIDKLSVQ